MATERITHIHLALYIIMCSALHYETKAFTVFTQMASCYVPAKHIHGGVCHTAQVVGVETLRKVL